ncbi:MAG: TolC family protein [Pseudolabrys sp.]|nr:TolC family protein [Pseudolabrys sp.]
MSSCWIALRSVCALFVISSPLAAQESSRPLALPQALQRALAANPRLMAAEREIGIAAGVSLQSRAIPNPELSAEVENFAGSGDYRGVRSAETTLQLSQLVELGGKREARGAAGVSGYESAIWQRRALRLEVLSETATAFVAVLGAQQRTKILEQQVAALGRLTPLLQRRVEAGASSPAEVLRGQIAADLVRVELQRARTSLATARRELTILMGDGTPRFGVLVGQFARTGRPPAFGTILASIDRNPQLMRWTAVRAQRDAELLTARLKSVPDVRVGVGWRHYRETGDNAMTFGLSMSLPLWDQSQGDVLAARESLEKVQADHAINKAALISVAGRAYDVLEGASQEIALLRSSVLPNARKASEAFEEGYAQGRFSLLEVLDVQASITQAALSEQEALQRFHAAVATIEGLVGMPFVLSAK